MQHVNFNLVKRQISILDKKICIEKERKILTNLEIDLYKNIEITELSINRCPRARSLSDFIYNSVRGKIWNYETP